jgi:hypothetical protein
MPSIVAVEPYRVAARQSLSHCYQDAKLNDSQAAQIECRDAGFQVRFLERSIETDKEWQAAEQFNAGRAFMIAGAAECDQDGDSRQDFRLAREELFTAEMNPSASPGIVKNSAETLWVLDSLFAVWS